MIGIPLQRSQLLRFVAGKHLHTQVNSLRLQIFHRFTVSDHIFRQQLLQLLPGHLPGSLGMQKINRIFSFIKAQRDTGPD